VGQLAGQNLCGVDQTFQSSFSTRDGLAWLHFTGQVRDELKQRNHIYKPELQSWCKK